MTETQIMESYHRSNLGRYTDGLRADQDGYVHLTTEAVLRGRWEDPKDEDEAAEIAAANREATAQSERAIAEWQQEG